MNELGRVRLVTIGNRFPNPVSDSLFDWGNRKPDSETENLPSKADCLDSKWLPASPNRELTNIYFTFNIHKDVYLFTCIHM